MIPSAETLLPDGMPVSLAYLDVVCTGLGGNFAIRSATSGLDPRFDLQLSAQDLRDRVVQVSLERPLRESDVVTLHARVTDETRVFIGRDQFDQMKGGAYS